MSIRKEFSKKESVMLTEIYRRLNVFHGGNLDANLLLLALPKQVKVINKFGLVKPFSDETPRILSWYSLTEKGKKFFSNYIETISNEMNLAYFDGREIKHFSKEIYEKLV
jgi:hypothetical protein